MKTLMPYIIFSGNCEEALNFYKESLNGEVTKIQRYAESPMFSNSSDISDADKQRIFDSEFNAEGLVFKASDDLPNHPVSQGSNVCLFLHFSDNSELEKVFKSFSEEGQVLFPLNNNFGMLVDKFSIRWMLAGS